MRSKKFQLIIIVLAIIIITLPDFVLASAESGTINPVLCYAWSNNIGTINFAPAGGNVIVTDFSVSGYAWSSAYGWINLNPTSGGVDNDAEGNLSGYAWGENLGWINFSGVKINSAGKFTGQASGNIIGTLIFDCLKCDVRTDWRPLTFRNSPSPLPPKPTANPLADAGSENIKEEKVEEKKASSSSKIESRRISEFDEQGNEIVCSVENFSPEMKIQRNKEAEEMKKKIEELIVQQKKESFLKRIRRLWLEKKFRGQILIQAESKGEAWYLNPVDNKRYFLGRPEDIFNIMVKLGLGATHQYITETKIFPARLAGRILIDVEDKGKAYYISPFDRKKNYLACPSHAFSIVKKMGTGVFNADLENIMAGRNP